MSTLLKRDMNHKECIKCCGKQEVILDTNNGECICNNCGTVIEDKLDFTDMEIRYNSIKYPCSNIIIGMPSLVQPDKGLSTLISDNNSDAYGTLLDTKQISKIRRLRKLDKMCFNHGGKYRNLKNAFHLLRIVKDKLSLNENIIEKSAYYYRKSLNLGLIKGRSIKEFIVACVYIVCRQTNLPHSIIEIAKAVNANHVFAGKCYRLLLRQLSISLPLLDPLVYLTKIANNAQISKKSLQRAIEMYSAMKENPVLCGKEPAALAMAVLYGACLETREKISQTKIAKAGNMSIGTLRNRLIDVQSLFVYLPNNRKYT